MIISQVIGIIVREAEMKKIPNTQKEYAFFIVVSKDEKERETFVKCYLYGCSKPRFKTLKVGTKIIVWGRQNVNIFKKENGETEININLNVTETYLP